MYPHSTAVPSILLSALQVMDCLPSQTFRQLGIQHHLNPLPRNLPQGEIAKRGMQVHSKNARLLLGRVFHSRQNHRLPIRSHKISELAS